MRKIIYICIVLFVAAISAKAQERYSIVSYSMGFATSDTKDFTKNDSYRGFHLEFGRYFNDDKMAAGLQLGYQNFYKELPKETYSIENGAITGKQYRYLAAMPILANGLFYPLGQESKIIPHVGLGLGTYYIDKRLNMGLYSIIKSTWHFGVAPQVGVSIPLNFNANFNINTQYNMAVKTQKSDAENWLTLSVGFRYIY